MISSVDFSAASLVVVVEFDACEDKDEDKDEDGSSKKRMVRDRSCCCCCLGGVKNIDADVYLDCDDDDILTLTLRG